MSKSIRTAVMSFIVILLVGFVEALPVANAQRGCPLKLEKIQIGDVVTGRIGDNQPLIQYCFEGTAGDQITIDLSRESGSLDAFLELTNIDGDEIYITNDDRSLSTTDAQIIFELPETATYVIHATRFDREDGSTQGTFKLLLVTDGANPEADVETERPDGCPALYDSIRYGGSFEGTIDDDNIFYAFCFVGQAGEEVVIDAEAKGDELDTYLFLTDLRIENVLAENDDVRLGNRDSRIVFTLPEDGAYLITVTRYDMDEGTTAGDFTMTLGVNDGTYSEEDLFSDSYEPNPYECNRPLIKQLNETQWLEENTDYDFRLNFGCEGDVAVSILGDIFVAPYTVTENGLQLELNEQTFIVELQSDNTLVMVNSEAQVFRFNDVGECSNVAVRDLQDGVWYLDENTTLFRLDFMCNGVVILTLDDLTGAYHYHYDVTASNLTIDSEDFIVWTEIFILPGSYLSVETEDGPFIFTNILTEIEAADEAGI